MEEDYLKKLVDRYLHKKSTDEELEIFIHLMKQGKLDKYLKEAMDNDISNSLHNDIYSKEHSHIEDREIRSWILRWSIAAAITMGLSLLAYNTLYKQTPAAMAKLHIIQIDNTSHTIIRQILPDNSIVWLNPETHLSYPSRFGKFREIKMEGEAFFEVTKDAEHPFIITSGKVKTKVWGTSFRIRSIAGEDNTKVSVLTGKVSVTVPAKPHALHEQPQPDTEVMLHPEEEVTYHPAGHHLLKAVVPPSSDLIIWRKANLTFENTRLEDIVLELNRYYHVNVEIEGAALRKYQLTADFTNKNLADILVLICKSVHTDYIKLNNRIILKTINQQPTIN